MVQQRGDPPALQRERVNLVADRAEALAPGPQARQLAQPGHQPGVGGLQVPGLLEVSAPSVNDIAVALSTARSAAASAPSRPQPAARMPAAPIAEVNA